MLRYWFITFNKNYPRGDGFKIKNDNTRNCSWVNHQSLLFDYRKWITWEILIVVIPGWYFDTIFEYCLKINTETTEMMTCKVKWSVSSSSCLITWCHVIKHDEGGTYHVNLHLITFVTSVFFPNPVGYSYTITHDSVPLKICFHIGGSYMGVVHSWTPTSYF